MRVIVDLAEAGQYAPTLVILLPGALQQPEDMMAAGFVQAVRQRQLALDLALVDLGVQYIGETCDGSALTRLHEFVASQKANGYRKIWLAGISIGGFMALAYAQAYPDNVTGLCLLAPYPGNRILIGEIRAAGGLLKWQVECAANDGECRVWQRLQEQIAMPEIYYGYPDQDRFAAGQMLMAEAFDSQCVDVVAGTHDWPAWQKLWNNFLDRKNNHFRTSLN